MILIRGNVERVAVDPAAITALREQGYKPIAGELREVNQPVEEEKETDLRAMKVQELRSLAKAKGIEGANALTKAELIELLEV